MDFDDLEDEVEKRLAEGENVEGYVKLSNQAPTGTVLPDIARSVRMPAEAHLPQKVQDSIPGPEPDRSATRKVYLLVCYGAGDAVMSSWIQMAREAPREVEMAIYEWPGHGIREDEPFVTSVETMAQDIFRAFRDAMDAGPFCLLGHSIGVTLCMAVAHIAKRELGVEPQMVFMLERAPPCYGVLNDDGVASLCSDIKSFMNLYTPWIGKMIKNMDSPDVAANVRRVGLMWQNDLQLEQSDMDSPMRRHVFNCDVHVVVAMAPFTPAAADARANTPAEEAFLAELARLKRSGEVYNFSREQFNDWSQWTTQTATVHEMDTDHFGVKMLEDVRHGIIWCRLIGLVASWNVRGGR